MRRTLIAGLLGVALLASGRAARAGDTSLGIEAGYVDPKAMESTVYFAGDFRFHLSKSFALAPNLSFWKKSPKVLGVTVSVGDFHFGANALWVIHAGRSIEIYAGAGGGFHHVSGDLVIRGGSAISGAVTKPGLDVLGGIDFRAGRSLSFFITARYDWILDLGGKDPSRLDQTKFGGGFRLRF
jgi:hypothetical protein